MVLEPSLIGGLHLCDLLLGLPYLIVPPFPVWVRLEAILAVFTTNEVGRCLSRAP